MARVYTYMHSGPIYLNKEASYSCLSKLGEGRASCTCARMTMSTGVAHGQKTLQTYSFPIQTHGKECIGDQGVNQTAA